MSLILILGGGCGNPIDPNTYQGYVEAEYLYLASPRGGQLVELSVERGQSVKASDRLFRLDSEPEETIRRAALEKLNQARAQLENLKKGLRPSELAALEAKLLQSKASLDLAQKEFQRVQNLLNSGVAAVDEMDRARATRDLYQAQVAQNTAELETAHLGGRTDEIRAAEAAAASAQATLTEAEWNLSQKSLASPTPGLIHDTLYRPGEWVAPGRPVVVLLPPDRLKVRFFVPQGHLTQLRPGAEVSVNFDGAAGSHPARISYLSTKAEFTPPVIYSQQTRDKLVFMIEAQFPTNHAGGIHPGQPVDVRLSH